MMPASAQNPADKPGKAITRPTLFNFGFISLFQYLIHVLTIKNIAYAE
jgi:hypothetical protein